jgi:4-hydroxybenzoate polyprenyltransferase
LTAATSSPRPPLSVAAVPGTILRPFLHRIRLGEGGLLGMAIWASAWGSRDAATVIVVALVTSVLLVALYLYNDVVDRDIDAYNPKKIAAQRQALAERPRFFLLIALATQVAAAAAAWWWLGRAAGLGAASLLVLNPFYSGIGKRVPGLDVIVVGAMGAALVALGTASPSLLLLAGVMTGISHAFQTSVDRGADLAAGVRSSGTAPASLRTFIWMALTVALAAAAYPNFGIAGCASALFPFWVSRRLEDANLAWTLSRLYFGVLWLAATVG